MFWRWNLWVLLPLGYDAAWFGTQTQSGHDLMALRKERIWVAPHQLVRRHAASKLPAHSGDVILRSDSASTDVWNKVGCHHLLARRLTHTHTQCTAIRKSDRVMWFMKIICLLRNCPIAGSRWQNFLLLSFPFIYTLSFTISALKMEATDSSETCHICNDYTASGQHPKGTAGLHPPNQNLKKNL
jgi:hypothetical protein